ncbi:MAG: hypothetical protein COB77_03300 [Gammaproteobacteria bacterium]|nr:MAG: hypothetical protein COB77_03300 [Gammaproteobacteria bacterium]
MVVLMVFITVASGSLRLNQMFPSRSTGIVIELFQRYYRLYWRVVKKISVKIQKVLYHRKVFYDTCDSDYNLYNHHEATGE